MKAINYLFVAVISFVCNVTVAQDGVLDTTFDSDGLLLPVYGSLESENMFVRVRPDNKIVTLETVSAHGSNPQLYLRSFESSGFHDNTFGVGGQVIPNFGSLSPRALALDIQADGKVLISGYLSGTGGGAFISRYNVNGTLDTGFGTSGVLTIESENWPSSFYQLAGGKMLITHGMYAGPKKLSRVNPNGTLDTTFGLGGTIDIPSLGMVSVQPDGKILLAAGGTDIKVTRYLSNGILDTTYGTAGTFTLNIDEDDAVNSVGMQSDSKSLFIARATNFGTFTSVFKLIRLTASGALDATFGTNGVVSLPFPSSALEFQAGGKIVVAGRSASTNDFNEIAIARFIGNNGALDTTFGTSGITTTSLGSQISVGVNDVKVGPDGKIVVGGAFCVAVLSCHPHSFVARYTTAALAAADFAHSSGFSVYPNPVNQVVNLDFSLSQSQDLTVDLYDINGRKITTLLDNVNFQAGSNSQQFDLPALLTPGIYFLNIYNGIYSTTVKIVK